MFRCGGTFNSLGRELATPRAAGTGVQCIYGEGDGMPNGGGRGGGCLTIEGRGKEERRDDVSFTLVKTLIIAVMS